MGGMSNEQPENDNESYHGYSVDGDNQPQDADDSLTGDGGTDPLDEGYSPAEKWSAAEGFGNTPFEEATGETLEQRLTQEVPESHPYEEDDREADNEEESAMQIVDEADI